MPVQSGVGVVDLLAQAVCMTVGTPGHEHAVGRHDLNLVPAVADVLGSDVHGGAHGVGADGVEERRVITHQPEVIAVVGEVFLVGNLHVGIGTGEVVQHSRGHGAVVGRGTSRQSGNIAAEERSAGGVV